MVKIAVAGGSGGLSGFHITETRIRTNTYPIELAREVIDALLATKKHDIIVISRTEYSLKPQQGLRFCALDYQDKDQLADMLRGVHTVLSFINQSVDHGNASQKALIDACVAAGVKRFAPSEYGW